MTRYMGDGSDPWMVRFIDDHPMGCLFGAWILAWVLLIALAWALGPISQYR